MICRIHAFIGAWQHKLSRHPDLVAIFESGSVRLTLFLFFCDWGLLYYLFQSCYSIYYRILDWHFLGSLLNLLWTH